MAGSDRVPDPNDSKRAQVGKRKTFYESEMALFHECIQKCARNVLDTADIVRDRDFSPVIGESAILSRLGFVERAALNYPSSSFTVTSFISLISVITMAWVPLRSNTIPVARTYLPTNGMSTCR